MNLYNSVYQLLKENDCVIIPEFGGFVANYFEAKVDLRNQEFCPPAKRIAFNQDLRSNDGLLINYVSKAVDNNWSLAEKNVKDFVEELNNILKSKGSLQFGSLGKIIHKDNTLVFIPNADLNLLEQSFGLKSFSYPMISGGKKAIEIQKPKELSKTKSAKRNKKSRTIKPAVFYTTAAAVIVGLLFISIQFDWIRLEKDPVQQQANVIPVEIVDSSTSNQTDTEIVNTEIDTETNSDEIILVDDSSDEVTTEVENVETEIVEPVDIVVEETMEVQTINQNLNIHIIGGSFADRTNALNYQSELIAKGFNSQILPAANGMYRVSVKSFADSESANAELSNLRSQSGNPSLWVLSW
ncbi:MAG: hypothetical protein C0596_00160 [Marinilabiliales bacterium]|nr:MAG: hypothetical protein C0596_00160 [Marinilabiliales bacterium]